MAWHLIAKEQFFRLESKDTASATTSAVSGTTMHAGWRLASCKVKFDARFARYAEFPGEDAFAPRVFSQFSTLGHKKSDVRILCTVRIGTRMSHMLTRQIYENEIIRSNHGMFYCLAGSVLCRPWTTGLSYQSYCYSWSISQ
jgi:hypothetical protein